MMLGQDLGDTWFPTLPIAATLFTAWGKLLYPTPGRLLIKMIMGAALVAELVLVQFYIPQM